MKDNERFWELLSRKLAGEVLEPEEGELQQLIDEDKSLKLKYDGILSYWGKSVQENEEGVEVAYKKVWARISDENAYASSNVQLKSKTRFLSTWVPRVAAMLLIALGIGWYFHSTNTAQQLWINYSWQSKKTTNGERSKLTLSDGSTIWLNAGSELKYPSAFNSSTREVYLTGEAFFEVTKNKQKPFIIHLHDGDVRVLGTSFNIRAFKDDPGVETSVVTGKVAFIPQIDNNGTPKDTTFLTPNFKAVYTKASGIVKKVKTKSDDDKAWAEGKLIFKSQRFEDVAKVLERSFGKVVVFENEGLKNCKLTGTFQNNSLDEVMQLFAQTKDYTYSISVTELHVRGSGCEPE